MPTGVGEGLAIGGVVLAIPSAIDLCIKYGSLLKEKYVLYKSMDEEMKLYNLVCNLVNGEMHDVLMFFKAVDTKLSTDLRGQIMESLLKMGAELAALHSLIAEKELLRAFDKLAFSLHKAKKIRKKCASLEEWLVRFLRRATVLLIFGGFSPNSEVRTIEEAAVRAAQRMKRIRAAVIGPNPDDVFRGKLPDEATFGDNISSAVFLKLLNQSQSIAECKVYGSSDDVEKKNNARHITLELANKLANVDSKTMGILRSVDVYDDVLRGRFVLRFEIPAGFSKVRTLQRLLTYEDNGKGLMHSLSDRIALAKKIASGLLFVHAGGFVHKKVNPTNIFIFETKDRLYPNYIGEPYLTGFDMVRKADDASARLETQDWKQNIYLHPDRHRLQPGDEFTMLHDIYSLGVVLLEIACWGSFTNMKGLGKSLYKSYTENVDGKEVVAFKHLSPDDLKKQYLRLAQKRIPPTLGTVYYELVESCLEGIPDNDGTRHDAKASVGSSYMEQVMNKLEDINL